MLKQSQISKITEVNEQNQEVALDFAGPFQNAKKRKKIPTCINRPLFVMAGCESFTPPNNKDGNQIFKTKYRAIWST